ncbi:MAG: glycosyltransferase family 4 protein [Desulfobacteraceae bacterium]|jgi:glycosyltransferase involved in cell wall biosynthesis
MNILYLLSQLPGSTGSGIYTRAMIDQATKAGHRCSLVAACSALTPPDESGIKADYIHLVQFDQEPLSFPIPGMSDVMPYPSSRFMDLGQSQLENYQKVFECAIRDAVEKTRPDIIHSNHLWIMSAMVRRLYPDIPLVVSSHGTDLRQFRNCPHLRNLLNCIPDVDGIFALTRAQKTEIADLYGVDEQKIHIVPNGFDPGNFYPGPKPSPPPFNLLYAGKLSESKGVHLLLESLNHENLRHLPIHLYLAGSGSGSDESQCHALARNLLGRVTFCGSLSPRNLGDIMRKSHIFVLPTYFEGLPLVIIEALASGCRIVATDLPGIREIVSGLQSGWGQLIELPPLETTDRPYDKDLPLIRNRLAHALECQIREHREKKSPIPDFFNWLKDNYSWEHVFKRVETIYRNMT